MSDEDQTFDPDELAAADRLDAQIDVALAGRAGRDVAPEVLLLATAFRTDPPPALGQRVATEHERVLERRWRPFRYVAALMASCWSALLLISRVRLGWLPSVAAR